MHFMWLPTVLAVLATPVLSVPHKPVRVPAGHVALERRQATSTQWMKRKRADPETTFQLSIALAHSNMEGAHAMLMDVSDPQSPNYGKHWTKEQVHNTFRPSSYTTDSVRSWLNVAGFPDDRLQLSENYGWLKINVTAEEAERLLHTQYHEFEHVPSGGATIACDQYHVPSHLSQHVDYITPGIQLDRVKLEDGRMTRVTNSYRSKVKRHVPAPLKAHTKKRRQFPKLMSNGTGDLSSCGQAMTPACIQALYNISLPTGTPNPKNTLGIYETDGQLWDQQDLNLFYQTLAPRIPAGTAPLSINIDGGVGSTTDPTKAGSEAMLDLAIAYPIMFPQTISLIDENDANYQNANQDYVFNNMLDAFDGSYCTYSAFGETGNSPMDPKYPDPSPGGFQGQLQCGTATAPSVISISYDEVEASLPVAYQERQCNEFMKLGLQGTTFVISSGDYGVGSNPSSANSNGCLGPQNNVFSPNWPSTCPYILSVGATMLTESQTIGSPEQALNPGDIQGKPTFSSSGGFSNIYAAPSYQQSAVASYFANNAPSYPSYNALANGTGNITSSTAMLDINALTAGSNGVFNRGGRGYPDVSANGAKGQSYQGLAPGSYDGTSMATPIIAAILNRINEERLAAGKSTVGFVNPAFYQNPAMFNDITLGSNAGCGSKGFAAVQGWDPVTGLGTPDFPIMLEYFNNLQ